MANANGFGALYSLLTCGSREELQSLKQAAFNTLFLFGYKQAENLASLRDPSRGTFGKTVIQMYQDIVPRQEKLEEYSVRFLRRLAMLNNVGGNMSLVLTPGTDIFKTSQSIVTWMRTRMAHEYKTYRDSTTHSAVKQSTRVPVLADAFLVIDLVMYGNDEKIFVK